MSCSSSQCRLPCCESPLAICRTSWWEIPVLVVLNTSRLGSHLSPSPTPRTSRVRNTPVHRCDDVQETDGCRSRGIRVPGSVQAGMEVRIKGETCRGIGLHFFRLRRPESSRFHHVRRESPSIAACRMHTVFHTLPLHTTELRVEPDTRSAAHRTLMAQDQPGF